MKVRFQGIGIGKYRWILDNGCCLDLEKCPCVPDCDHNLNLVFVRQLDKLGVNFKIRHHVFSLYK